MLTEARLDELRGLDSDGDALRSLLETFLHDTTERLDAIMNAVEAKDVAAVRIHAHTLKGAAAVVGAEALASAAGDIEQGCRHGRLPDDASLAALRASGRAAQSAVAALLVTQG